MQKPTTVQEYINQSEIAAKKHLKKIRKLLQDVVPDAEEGLKWSTPAFSYHRVLFTYAAFKYHVGFYPTPAAIAVFEKELAPYKTGKGSIQFPLDQPLPEKLITDIATWRAQELKEHDAKWM